MSARAAGLVLVLAALPVVVLMTLPACGEKEERVSGPSSAEVAALAAVGLRVAGSDRRPSRFTYSADGQALRIRMASPVTGGPLDRLLASFDRVRGTIERFCPKPALLRCRPALRVWAAPRSRHAVRDGVAALRRLAARAYDGRMLVRRRGRVTRIVTANGELLAVVRPVDAGVAFSFGGLDVPPRPRELPPAGGLGLEADPSSIAAIQANLPPRARRALAGVRRLTISAPLGAASR